MRTSLVIDLVKAHKAGTEEAFSQAVLALADDEERKGNLTVAASLRNACASQRSTNVTAPRDRQTYFGPAAASGGLASRSHSIDVDHLFHTERPAVRLSDLVLPPEQLALFRRVIDEVGDSRRLATYGLHPTARILLCGPPGCGKTQTARALAGEMGRDLVQVHLDALMSSYLGQTGLNIRRLFESQYERPVLILLDEFDAIAKTRDDPHELGELKRAVTALLQLLDTMSPDTVLVAATNHEHLLDSAIWRRFDLVVRLDKPDSPQRATLLEHFLKPFSTDDISLDKLAALFDGSTPSEIEESILQAARVAISARGKPLLKHADIVSALVGRLALNAPTNSPVLLTAAQTLHARGVSLRVLADALGLPHSTLADRLRGSTNGKRSGLEEVADD